jgi:hypothetical protein
MGGHEGLLGVGMGAGAGEGSRMTDEKEFEAARTRVLQQMQEIQSRENFSKLRTELIALNAKLEQLKRKSDGSV